MEPAAIFGTTQQVDIEQECARAIVIFAFGLFLVRVAGRRVFGKWAALDITVSSLARTLAGSNLIQVHIARLRRKLDVAGKPSPIATVKGEGYRLDAV